MNRDWIYPFVLLTFSFFAGRANFRAFPGRQSGVVRPRRDGIPWDPLICPAPGRGDRRMFCVARRVIAYGARFRSGHAVTAYISKD